MEKVFQMIVNNIKGLLARNQEEKKDNRTLFGWSVNKKKLVNRLDRQE